MAVSGILEGEVDITSSFDRYFNVWTNQTHMLPTFTPMNFQGRNDTHGAIKLWEYTINGKTEVFKETVEFDKEKLTFKLQGLEGDVFLHYKVFNFSCRLIPKEDGSGGAVAKLFIEYEKIKKDVPNPDPYMELFKSFIKDIDAHASQLSS